MAFSAMPVVLMAHTATMNGGPLRRGGSGHEPEDDSNFLMYLFIILMVVATVIIGLLIYDDVRATHSHLEFMAQATSVSVEPKKKSNGYRERMIISIKLTNSSQPYSYTSTLYRRECPVVQLATERPVTMVTVQGGLPWRKPYHYFEGAGVFCHP